MATDPPGFSCFLTVCPGIHLNTPSTPGDSREFPALICVKFVKYFPRLPKKHFLVLLPHSKRPELRLLSPRGEIQAFVVTPSFPSASGSSSSLLLLRDEIANTDFSTQMSHKTGSEQTPPLGSVCCVTSFCFPLIPRGFSSSSWKFCWKFWPGCSSRDLLLCQLWELPGRNPLQQQQ